MASTASLEVVGGPFVHVLGDTPGDLTVGVRE